MKVLIVINEAKQKTKLYLKELTKCLDKYSISYDISSREHPTDKTDYKAMFVIGGDGTILEAIQNNPKLKCEVLGFNCGHKGFLTQVSDISEIEEAVEIFYKRKYSLDVRTMVNTKILRADKEIFSGNALNEILITKKDPTHVTRFSLYINDTHVSEYASDGYLISTPTGSTAYNLSAGGPIVSPQSKTISLIAICPHAFNNRSLVIEDDSKIHIKINSNNSMLSTDSGALIDMQENDDIYISKSKKKISFIKIKNENFFVVLEHKMERN